MSVRRSLRRPKRFTIGNKNADLCIPGANNQYLVEENVIYQDPEKEIGQLYINGRKVEGESSVFQTGDTICIEECQMTILEDRLHIESQATNITTSLLELEETSVPFEDFPKIQALSKDNQESEGT